MTMLATSSAMSECLTVSDNERFAALITSHQNLFSNFYLAADVRVHDLKLQEDVVAEIFAVMNICAFSFRFFVLINSRL